MQVLHCIHPGIFATLRKCSRNLLYDRSIKKIINRSILSTGRLFSTSFRLKMDRATVCRVAVTQMNSTCDRNSNWQQLEGLVCKAVEDGAQVVFLPEGCDYIASNRQQSIDFAEDINGQFVNKLKHLAKNKQVWLSAGGIHVKSECSDARLSNTHLLISNDGVICSSYAKAHLFSNSIPGASINEGDYVRPGEEIVAPVPSPAGNIGLAICYDLRFPDLSQTLRRLGAHILTFPSAFTVVTGRAHWHTLLQARAIECQSYVIAAAQVGQHNAKRSSYGHAMIVDPWGRVLCELKEEVGVAVSEVDIAALLKVRREMPCILHSRQDLASLSLQPSHSQPRLSYNERLPEATVTQQFGSVSVPGDAIFLYTALSFGYANLYPRVYGHSMVSPRRAVQRFQHLSAGELCDLAQQTILAVNILCKRHSVQQCEVAIQDGPLSGQTIKHVHVHLLPSDNKEEDDSLLSPDVVSASQTAEALQQTRQTKVAAMLSDAAANRVLATADLLHNDEEAALHLPRPFSPLPVTLPDCESALPSSTNVPADVVVCLNTTNTLAYCINSNFQKCHFVVELRREVETLSEVYPDEAYELFAAAHRLQELMDKLQPDISTTFIIKGKSKEYKSVQLHMIPWLVARKPSDQVYSYVSSCKKVFTENEIKLAAFIRSALYEGQHLEDLRSTFM